MAIDIKLTDRPMDVRDARNFLQRQTDNFGIFFDIDRCFELSAILQLDMKDLQRKARRFLNKPNFDLNDKNGIINALIGMGVNKLTFMESGQASYTAPIRKEIVNNPSYSDDIKEFVNMTADFTSAKRNKGNIENFALDSIPTDWLSYDHRRMGIGRPTWVILNTSRLGAENPGIQGIPRSMADIITYPEGYRLLRCDSGQIEPRINVSAFLKDELMKQLIIAYNDAYFGYYHFCIMKDSEIEFLRAHLDQLQPIEISDDIKAGRQNIKTLTNAGSYGSTHLAGINQSLAKAYEKRIVNHPNRIAIEQKVRDDYRRGIETFYGFFGTPVTPQETQKHKRGSASWPEHVIRCGINNPVQTTAAELMRFSIAEAREAISRLSDTHVCFWKHDEAAFYISEDDMDKPEVKILEDVTAYNVENWIPIESDPIWGVKHGDYPSYLAAG